MVPDANLVRIGSERVENISDTRIPDHSRTDGTQAWDADAFRERLEVSIKALSQSAIEFDLVGVDSSVANAIRRVLIAEVPTVAIETVYVWNNTSIVQDEVLAQRLGLVPLAIDPAKLSFKRSRDEEPTDLNTVVFNLVARCERNPEAKKGETDPNKAWTGTEVLSSQLDFDPKGSQLSLFEGALPKPANENILLAKLRGNQEIVAELHCNKGIGKEHAKWSPVATASYRLLPSITLLQPIPRDLTDRFAACFPPGVVDVSDGRVRIADARKDFVSREVLRHPEIADKVSLGRVKDHFIFSLESAGQLAPPDLVPAAIVVLKEKLQAVRHSLTRLKSAQLQH